MTPRIRNSHTASNALYASAPRHLRGIKSPQEALHRAAYTPAPPTLKVTTCYGLDSTLLQFTGTLDVATLGVFRDSVFRAIGERPQTLCLDLSELAEPLSSEAMHVLVTAARVARMVNVPCRVIPRHDLRDVLYRTHLDRLIPVAAHLTSESVRTFSTQKYACLKSFRF